MTDPMATRIVEVRIGPDAAPLLLVDGVPVDLAAGEDPEQAGTDQVAADARRAGRPVPAVLVLDGGSTRWRVRIHPDGTVTDQPDDAPSAPRRGGRPVAWLVGAVALALLAVGGHVALTAPPAGSDAPVTSGVAVPTWAAELPMPAGPTPVPATTPEPAPVLAAAPDPVPSILSTRATPRRVQAPAAPTPTPPTTEPPAAPLVELEPASAAPSSPGTGASQRGQSQPSPPTTSVSPAQRGRSGT